MYGGERPHFIVCREVRDQNRRSRVPGVSTATIVVTTGTLALMSVGGSRKCHAHGYFVEGVARGSHTCEMKAPGSGQEQLGEHYASKISDQKLPNRKDQ